MQPNIRRDRALIALLIAGAALNIGASRVAAGRSYAIPPPTPLPLAFEGWTGTAVPTMPSTQAILPHARITQVNYEQKGQLPVSIVVTASRDPNDMHTPERCITGGGAGISDREMLTLNVPGPNGGTWPMNQLVANEQGDSSLILYCYDNVPQLGGTTWATRIMMKIKPMVQPAYFVRFSTSMAGDKKATQDRLMTFAAHYMEARHGWETPTSPK